MGFAWHKLIPRNTIINCPPPCDFTYETFITIRQLVFIFAHHIIHSIQVAKRVRITLVRLLSMVVQHVVSRKFLNSLSEIIQVGRLK